MIALLPRRSRRMPHPFPRCFARASPEFPGRPSRVSTRASFPALTAPAAAVSRSGISESALMHDAPTQIVGIWLGADPELVDETEHAVAVLAVE